MAGQWGKWSPLIYDPLVSLFHINDITPAEIVCGILIPVPNLFSKLPPFSHSTHSKRQAATLLSSHNLHNLKQSVIFSIIAITRGVIFSIMKHCFLHFFLKRHLWRKKVLRTFLTTNRRLHLVKVLFAHVSWVPYTFRPWIKALCFNTPWKNSKPEQGLSFNSPMGIRGKNCYDYLFYLSMLAPYTKEYDRQFNSLRIPMYCTINYISHF